MNDASNGALALPDALADVIVNAPGITEGIQALLAPARSNKEHIRALFGPAIRPIPNGERTYWRVSAADGGYTINNMVIGDHVTTLAVSATQHVDPTIGTTATAPRIWSQMRAHSPDQETLARAIMMTDELALLRGLQSDTVAIIDGSHSGHLAAIATALASADPAVRDEVIARAAGADLIDTITESATARHIVACPKSDSSTALWAYVADQLGLRGSALPDKVVATLILDPGEMILTPHSTVAFERFTAAVARASGPALALAQRLEAAAAPLLEHPLRVAHLKPVGGDIALRVEMKPDVDDFAAADLIQAIAADCQPPFVQEPLTQYLADLGAKAVSALAEVQMGRARLDLDATGDGTYQALLRNYRT